MSIVNQKSSALGAWFLGIIISLLFVVMLGLLTVWISIEKTDIAYSIRNLQVQTEEKRIHKAKLEVERESLLSPYELGKKAEALNMFMAKPGQIRRMEIEEK